MKPDLEKAELIGSRLLLFKDSLAKRNAVEIDEEELRAILEQRSQDTLVASQELVMAWRFYTLQRELQIGGGEFHACSSPEDIREARSFLSAKKIVFDPANTNSIKCVESDIRATIAKDALSDADKWKAVEAKEEKRRCELAILWKPSQSPLSDTPQDAEARRTFTEENLKWYRSKEEVAFRKYSYYSVINAIRLMMDEHRNYWAQCPIESYDESGLDHIFTFVFHGPNHGLGELFTAWDRYLEARILSLGHQLGPPYETCTDDEKAAAKEDRRKRPIEWPHSHPNAREIMESHIRGIIREDIVADSDMWKRHKGKVEAAKRLYQEHRLKRIQDHENAFRAKVRNTFGPQVLEMISKEDVERYGVSIADCLESEENLWYSILKDYSFDQNTSSCLYFIRQGTAIKIGITDDLDRRFAQIKTSAANVCKIENVVYTHHGRTLERKLHQALARYRSHLEWFNLPSRIEHMLFTAKSAEDIEKVLKYVTGNNHDDSLML